MKHLIIVQHISVKRKSKAVKDTALDFLSIPARIPSRCERILAEEWHCTGNCGHMIGSLGDGFIVYKYQNGKGTGEL